MFDAVVRRSGNSLIVTVPKDEVERLGIKEGSRVRVEAQRLEERVVLPEALRQSLQRWLPDHEAALRYLADK